MQITSAGSRAQLVYQPMISPTHALNFFFELVHIDTGATHYDNESVRTELLLIRLSQ